MSAFVFTKAWQLQLLVGLLVKTPSLPTFGSIWHSFEPELEWWDRYEEDVGLVGERNKIPRPQRCPPHHEIAACCIS